MPRNFLVEAPEFRPGHPGAFRCRGFGCGKIARESRVRQPKRGFRLVHAHGCKDMIDEMRADFGALDDGTSNREGGFRPVRGILKNPPGTLVVTAVG